MISDAAVNAKMRELLADKGYMEDLIDDIRDVDEDMADATNECVTAMLINTGMLKDIAKEILEDC